MGARGPKRSAQKVVVLEINEVPLRVLERYAAEHPDSALAGVLAHAQVFRTYANDVPEGFLYPAQSWASFNTGAPYAKHQIHWYNDPKPLDYPFYWQDVAARGHSVGLINTLHSTPVERIVGSGPYRFIIPDCFADDPATHPAHYRAFQTLNLQLTRANGRITRLSTVFDRATLRALASPKHFGLTPQSAREIFRTLAGIAVGTLTKERLRNLQFPLLAEIFLHELRRTDVDLAILFTNHIAASQHRYWYALFPDDFSEPLYPDAWVRRYQHEILDAVALLDRYLLRLIEFCQETDRVMIVSSSMGQRGSQKLARDVLAGTRFDFRLEDPPKLLRTLVGSLPPFHLQPGMIPQNSFVFEHESAANAVGDQLHVTLGLTSGLKLRVDVNQNVLTLGANLDPSRNTFSVHGRELGYRELGFARFEVDDHHSGQHHPEGSLVVFNDKRQHFLSRFPESKLDYLEYAPAIRDLFDSGAGSGAQEQHNAAREK